MSGLSDRARELLVSVGKAESNAVLVAVQDTGPGLAPATIGRLFESFCTTKPGGLARALDLPFYRRSAWRTIEGDRERAPRRCISIQITCPSRHFIVIGRQDGRST